MVIIARQAFKILFRYDIDSYGRILQNTGSCLEHRWNYPSVQQLTLLNVDLRANLQKCFFTQPTIYSPPYENSCC